VTWRPIVYVQDGVSVTYTKYGRKICANARDMRAGAPVLLDGEWERWVSDFLLRAMRQRKIPKEALCIDVGANCGWYSLIMRYAGEQEGQHPVWAYEPHPVTAKWLRHTFDLNGMGMDSGCQVFEKAAGAVEGTFQLWIEPLYLGNASISPPNKVNRAPLEVQVVRLDDEVMLDEQVAIIKIDAEWAEREVLAGAHKLIARNADHIMLVVEWHRCKELQRELVGLAQDHNFEVAVIEHDSNVSVLDVRDDWGFIDDSEMLVLLRKDCKW